MVSRAHLDPLGCQGNQAPPERKEYQESGEQMATWDQREERQVQFECLMVGLGSSLNLVALKTYTFTIIPVAVYNLK